MSFDKNRNLPSISIVIPTLNAGEVLEDCLESITFQKYPKNLIELIIADGGSTDKTLTIAKRYHATIFTNKLKTGESGKAVGVKKATGEIIALIDSDNILPDPSWLTRMIEPFADKTIVATEPLEFTYRPTDPYLTRYFAMLGMNDPICLFTGNYDRQCLLTGRWTNLHFPATDCGNYLKITLDHEPIPTIGANGTLIHRSALSVLHNNQYLFDIDVLVKLIRNSGSINVAKVKAGIVHTFVGGDMTKFFRKQLRRIDDMSFHHSQNSRLVDWESLYFWKIVYFQLQCLLFFPILYQMIKGYFKKPDLAWLFHPLACYSTLFIYLFGWLKGKISPKESNRSNWTQ